MPYHIFFQQYYYCKVRYIIIETKEFARIGYNGLLFPHSYSGDGLGVSIVLYPINIRLKIKPNSVRIRFLSCQIVVLPSTGFELTLVIHCSTIHLALHPLPIKGVSIIVVLPYLVRQVQRQTQDMCISVWGRRYIQT